MESEEPMDVVAGADYDKFDDLLEEGEYEEPNNRVSRKVHSGAISNKDPPASRYENKGGSFITGVDIFSKESKEKLEERAKRFGIPKTKDQFALEEAENLYESFGMNDNNIRDYRLNVIHIRGTQNMSTADVFDYFNKYAPASLEWINDISCNVVWLDNPSAARAMLGLSKKIIGIRKEPKRKIHSDDETEEGSDDDLIIVNGKHSKDENSIHIKDIRCPLPPGIWRKGKSFQESTNIFLRFATRTDKKGFHAEKMSEYYKKHGNPNYGGVKGILTNSRKRAYRQMKESSPSSIKESSFNGIAAKNPWGTLSKNWGRADFVEREYVPKEPPLSSNIKERLGYRRASEDEDDDDDVEEVIELSDDSESKSSSDGDEWSKRSKMPRMRMHADDEEQKIEKRKGKIRKLTEKMVGSDLRGRLTARRRLPPVDTEAIQVVVTNPKAVKSDFSNIDVTEDEEDEDDVQLVASQDDDEEEEGEIIEESESDGKVEYEDDEDEEEVEEVDDEEEEQEEEEGEEEEDQRSEMQSDEETSDSSLSEKEVRGPKGSVIKVVQHKPKLASTVSTVWSRLHHSKKDKEKSSESKYSKGDLRHSLKKTDLRSRIGNHTRGRSPLRIELRNDKYSARHHSDSD